MSARTVTPLRPLTEPGYTDTAALNDIHTILTRRATAQAGELVAELAGVLTRTGRPMVAARDIEITATETAQGWPIACVQADDTTVYVRQDPAGAGLLVEITTKTEAEASALTITLDGRTVHPAARLSA